jgi:8-oxo-dGTP pyrophosphatase MutT (NUDIX family)
MHESPIAPARPASTVIVMREAADATAPFELLMVRRNDTVAFMAGSFVFPGGRVDDFDRPRDGETLSPATFVDLTPAEEAAYRRAAVRELQEEANVTITVDDLYPFAHWVTPEIETRRYDTRFFLARMPHGQDARHDEGETTALEWLSPAAAIGRFERRELLLPPPTWTSIRQLASRTSIDDAIEWTRHRKIARIMPGFRKSESEFMLMLPGDPLMPAIADWEVPEETRFVLEDGARWQPVAVSQLRREGL